MRKKCVGSPEGKWPRSLACKNHGGGSSIADKIWQLSAVVAWVYEVGDDEARDCRACSLTVATMNAWRNACQPWETPSAHRSRYVKLAERLEAAPGYTPGGKRLTKLRTDLSRESKATFLAGAAESEPVDMVAFAALARVFADAAGNTNWTISRPKHGHAARNDFVRALTAWQRDFTGKASHVLTAAVTNALFASTLETGEIGDAAIERLTRN